MQPIEHIIGHDSADASADLLQRSINQDRPLAVVCHEDGSAHVFSGPVTELDMLSDIPRTKNLSSLSEGIRYDTLSLIPYSQIRERGFDAQGSDERIRCMQIQEQTYTTMKQLLQVLPDEPILLEQGITYSMTKQEYAGLVSQMKDQISNGNACNVVLHLKAMAAIADMSPIKALSILKNLLRCEFGAYMTFCFYDGMQYHIGATPERHLTVNNGTVTMNPISGTYRKMNGRIDPEAFKRFLENPKEQNELFMCMDEELKQMAQMCSKGGRIVGPLLKEMSRLVHTEYLLIGRSDKDVIELLRSSMHAPTVTGSPQQSACRIIANTEKESRGYYAGEIVLIGHDQVSGMEVLDSAITIRTMAVLPSGLLVVRAGASIVRDSIEEEEAAEAYAKAGSPIQALVAPPASSPAPQLPTVLNKDLQRVLNRRNCRHNRYLFEVQESQAVAFPELNGKTATIVNHEDDFAFQLKHMMELMGMRATVVPFEAFDVAEDATDIVVLGPGPGNPLDETDGKMRKMKETAESLLQNKRALLAVCLGHQELCKQLGFTVARKDVPTQGVRQEINFFGSKEYMGFYNAFSALKDADIEGVDVCADEETGEIHALRGPHYSSMQFHPESIFSENGFRILANELRRILRS